MGVAPELFIQGFNVGLFSDGQVMSSSVQLTVAASNTVEGTHQYASVPTTFTFHFHDPDGVKGSGDETADPVIVTVPVPDTVWHPVDAASDVRFVEAFGVATIQLSLFGLNTLTTLTCTSSIAPPVAPAPFLVVNPFSQTRPPLPVSFASLTNSVCTVAGSTVTLLLTAGLCTIEATQPGNDDWDPAPPVDRSFIVGYSVSNLSPHPHASFTPGSKIPVMFKLTGVNGLLVPSFDAAHLGCSVTASFDSGSPVCAPYDACDRVLPRQRPDAEDRAHTQELFPTGCGGRRWFPGRFGDGVGEAGRCRRAATRVA